MDYRGEIGVILANQGSVTQTIKHGDAIAQMVLVPVEKVSWSIVQELDNTERGDGGFGSTTVQ